MVTSGDPPRVLPRPVDPLIGRQLGEYVVGESLGEGGFGKVYRAQQAALSREAVIKVLHVGRRVDEVMLRRFTAEAQIASRLDHPYAAHVYGFGAEEDGLLWIAMELVRGAPLDVELTLHGPIKLERFVPFFERVCEVVHTAHEQNIVHRDLKPANIMVLARAGRLLPKLLDFGIAKVLSTVSPDIVLTRPIVPTGTAEGATLPLPAAPDAPVVPPVSITDPAFTGNDILGSPHYMAPEQWDAPQEVDARTDIYALGAVAFEALTGKRAFDGKTLAAVQAAHTGPIPKLPAGFPKSLDDVLARATAQRKSDRYASALELAESVRAAAGLKSERGGLPQLERRTRMRYIERAPEPIADAVVALEAAENAHAARDAISHVARGLCRWLGILALACRTRVGTGGGDSHAIQQRLRALRRDGLREHDWLELARDLVRPFAERRDAYPIPELVACLVPRTGDADAGAPLEALLALCGTTNPDENVLRARLPDLTKQLADVLAATWFLTDYDLVVPRVDRIERFVGGRRLPRMSSASAELAAHDGKPVLLDGDGAPALVLWPLVQADAPSAGADRELFVLDGPGRTGARLVAPRQGFELHDATLWDWFQRTLGGRAESDVSLLEERPYLGLATFTEAEAHLFFGREREVDAFVNRLRVTPWLAVVGPSGAGKSSFVRAGALPALGWRALIMRPGATPLAALAARLGRSGVGAAELAARPELLGETLRAGAGAGVVLVVDQLEELFTLCTDATEREQFARALALAVHSADEPVRIIVTLRDDFLMRTEGIPALRERLAAGLSLLGTPVRADLVRILVEPARRAGYELEDDALGTEIAEAVADRPNALALLSFSAAALWELRDRHFKHLTRKAYQSIGGVGGALARHAEATLANMPADQRSLVRDAFRRLVTAEGTRAVLTRAELAQVLGGTRKAEDVIEALVAARLLATSDAEDGQHLEVTHEALLSAWPRLVEWRREDAEGAHLRDQLRAAARQWDERGRPSGLLWRGDALAEFQIWRGRTPGSLTELEEAFTGAALRDAARGKRGRRIVLASAFGFLLCALAGVLWLNAQAKAGRARAVQSLATLHQEQGRLALLDGHPAHALVHLAEAARLGASGPVLEVLVAAAVRPIAAGRLALAAHTGAAWSVAYSHDGRLLATGGADGTARIWNAATGKPVHTLRGHTKDVAVVAFSADDKQLATASWDGSVRVWDSASGGAQYTLALGREAVAIAFSPDGTRVVGAATGGTQIWDARTGRTLATLAVAKSAERLAWSHDGRVLITGGSNAQLWDGTRGTAIATFENGGQVTSLAVSHDDRRIAIGSADGAVEIWDLHTHERVATLFGHTNRVRHVLFSADGRRLVSVSSEAARIWDTVSARLETAIAGGEQAFKVAALSSQGDVLVTTSTDGTIRLWDLATGTLRALRAGHAGDLNDATFRPDGRELASAGADGTVRIWDASPDQLVATATSTPRVDVLATARDGQILTAGKDLVVQLWSPELRLVRTLPAGKRVAASADASTIAIGDAEGAIRLLGPDRRVAATLSGHTAAIADLQLAPDGATLVSASDDGTARVTRGARSIVLTHDTVPNAIALSADGRHVATAGQDGALRIWSADTGALEAKQAFTSGWMQRVRYSADGHRLVTAHQEAIAAVWDADTHARLGVLEGHRREVANAAFSPDGALVVTGSSDKTIRIWDAVHFKPLAILHGHGAEVTDVAFTSDREVVSTGEDRTLRRWRIARDARTPEALGTFVRCRVALGLDANGSVVPRSIDRAACPPD